MAEETLVRAGLLRDHPVFIIQLLCANGFVIALWDLQVIIREIQMLNKRVFVAHYTLRFLMFVGKIWYQILLIIL